MTMKMKIFMRWALDGVVLKSGPVYREGGLQWELWG